MRASSAPSKIRTRASPGAAIALLAEAGVEVATGVCAEAALRANLGHVLRVTSGRPMVSLKLALTADGFAAGAEGDPRLAITGAAANGYVHMLRAMHDAVLVGAGTALADDPLLTVRLAGLEARKPLRVVLDTRFETAAEVASRRDRGGLSDLGHSG